jgi:hypothetical protein
MIYGYIYLVSEHETIKNPVNADIFFISVVSHNQCVTVDLLI